METDKKLVASNSENFSSAVGNGSNDVATTSISPSSQMDSISGINTTTHLPPIGSILGSSSDTVFSESQRLPSLAASLGTGKPIGTTRPNIIQLPGSIVAAGKASKVVTNPNVSPIIGSTSPHRINPAIEFSMNPNTTTANDANVTTNGDSEATEGAVHIKKEESNSPTDKINSNDSKNLPATTHLPSVHPVPPSDPQPNVSNQTSEGSYPIQGTGKMELHDAFAYLDRVKAEFLEQPDVYNRFLQIMREFKANVIDANGVIVRVVQLFKGHKNLIQGFNSFLPRTHHIDPTVAETGVLPPHLMQVAISMGITVNAQGIPISLPPIQPQSNPLNLSRPPPHIMAQYPQILSFQAGLSGAPHLGNQMMPLGNANPGQSQIPISSNQQISHGSTQMANNQQHIHGTTHHQPQGWIGGAQHHLQEGGPYYPQSMAMHGQYNQQAQFFPPSVPQNRHHLPNQSPAHPPPQLHHPNQGNSGMFGAGNQSHVSATQQQPHVDQQPPKQPQPAAPSQLDVRRGVPGVVPPSAAPAGGNAQFVRAISYVKKIKHRFANEPEIYKTFLAALHSYHKEQKSIFDVYMEVSGLFSEHPDLLEEFVLFLPEHEAATISSRLAMANSTATASTPNSGSAPEAAAPPVGTVPQVSTQTPAANVNVAAPPGSRSTKKARQAARVVAHTAEESAFYERVKRYLGDRNAYGEFLKCLNLFCQGIIRMQDLVQLVHRFIGANEDLFSWFKRYIGYKEHQQHNINRLAMSSAPRHALHLDGGGMVGSSGTQVENILNEDGEVNLAMCRRVGSYRIFPKGHILPRSTHRTPIGLETINDAMVSVPVFSSEESTFLASKKNVHEEALFRCEDERFELDMLIDCNQAAISVFEPLTRRISLMTPEERSSLSLGPNLGGTSPTIYLRAVRRVYGDKTDEVIAGLRNNTAVALPIVLARLKQKDEEWRRVQRDWNRVWRDIHLKNYYRALDYQALEVRSTDRRTLAPRALISEIESAALEQRRMASRYLISTIDGFGSDKSSDSASTTSHWSVKISEVPLLVKDLCLLIHSHLYSVPGFNTNDRKAIGHFLASFLPSFLCVLNAPPPTPEVNKEAKELKDTKPVLLFANNNLYVAVRLMLVAVERLQYVKQASDAAGGHPYCVEKRAIISAFIDAHDRSTVLSMPVNNENEDAENSKDSDAPTKHLETTTQNVSNDIAEESLKAGDFYRTTVAMLAKVVSNTLDPNVFEERVRFMFGLTAYPIFTFERLLQALIKQIQIVLLDPTCEQLIRLFDSWNHHLDPSTVTSNKNRLSEYSCRIAAESAVASRENIFRIVSIPCEGEKSLDSVSKSLKISVPKNDNGKLGGADDSLNIVDSSESFVPSKEHEVELPRSTLIQITLVERLIDPFDGRSGNGSGTLDSGSPSLAFPGGKSADSAEARWSAYVENFVRLESNERYLDPQSRVFLPRNRRRCHEHLSQPVPPHTLQVEYNLECKIAVNTYKIFYVENTEDFLYRSRPQHLVSEVSPKVLSNHNGDQEGDENSNKEIAGGKPSVSIDQDNRKRRWLLWIQNFDRAIDN